MISHANSGLIHTPPPPETTYVYLHAYNASDNNICKRILDL